MLDFLFGSDLPLPLQIFWKLLVLSQSALPAYLAATTEHIDTSGVIVMATLSGLFFLLAIFMKLGE